MKILHISSAKTFGGGERHLVELCRGLNAEGHEVFLALRPTNEWEDKVDFLPRNRILHVTLRNAFGVFSAKRIAAFMRRNGIELIHAHLMRDYVPASIAARMAGDVPFFLTRHVVFKLKPFYRFALRNLTRAIAVSEPVATALREVFPHEKVVTISNGIDVNERAEADRESLRRSFRAEYGIPQDAPLVGIIGELNELKGQGDFILAAERIVKQNPAARFIVVGRDSTIGSARRRELRRLGEVLGLSNQLLFLEWVDDTKPLIAALDVLVSASYTESFGLAMLESIAGGTAVVATRTDGACELIEDGRSGLLVSVGEPVAIAEAVDQILKNSELKKTIESNARSRAIREFSAEKMVDRTVELYREVLR